MARKTGRRHVWVTSRNGKSSWCEKCGMDKPTDPAKLARVQGDCHPTRLPGF